MTWKILKGNVIDQYQCFCGTSEKKKKSHNECKANQKEQIKRVEKHTHTAVYFVKVQSFPNTFTSEFIQ